MKTLNKSNDLELMEFTSDDIENANERIVKNTNKNHSKVKLSIWDYILILFRIKSLNAIVLDENTINETWERVKSKHINNE
ncbi:putative nucleic acid-binding protein [Runella defluvii]|uniref:Putative nucleic acid-binding protein n=1 Tax=Runella defluvii TaxID=370973 RepID=A0A7W5ZH23_9BACT|nr:putative nucleic acid-binding protein [Runella defluvii]